MKSKGAVITYFILMMINLYVGVMMVQWLFTIAVGIAGTTLLMIYFYLMRNQDELLNRAWRSIYESWPTMVLWQRASMAFLFPVYFMLVLMMVIAEKDIDKKRENNERRNANNH